MESIFKKKSILCLRLSLLCVFSASLCIAQKTWTKADSGWISLYDGKDWDSYVMYVQSQGVITDISGQDLFVAEDSLLHGIGATSRNSYLFTKKSYSWYHVRVDYKFMEPGNAGLLVHTDIDQMQSSSFDVSNSRPRSIEINMKREGNDSWTLWAAGRLGPYMSTTVRQGSHNYLPADEGGVDWTNDPWGDRIIDNESPNVENPPGEWNHGEAIIMGDSLGIFILNGQTRAKAWDFKLRNPASPNDGSVQNRIPCSNGSIGLQYEGQEIYYKNWEIRLLDSTNQGSPIIPGCPDSGFDEFKPFRTLDDNSLCLTPLAARSRENSDSFTLRREASGLSFSFKIKAERELRIFNLKGNNVYKFTTDKSNKAVVPVGAFSPGLYWVRVSPGENDLMPVSQLISILP